MAATSAARHAQIGATALDRVTLTIELTLDRSLEDKPSSPLTNCGAGTVTRTQEKPKPGSSARCEFKVSALHVLPVSFCHVLI